MRFFWPIAKVDAEQRMVWGYASTEALDEQGEIVRREALEAALGTYMRFANIREMHQPSAVGVAKEALSMTGGSISPPRLSMTKPGRRSSRASTKGFRSAAALRRAIRSTGALSPGLR